MYKSIYILICLLFSVNANFLRNSSSEISFGLSMNSNCSTIGIQSEYCSFNGICTTSTSCKCDDGYITFPTDNKEQCNYKQKSMLIAFLLSFFLGIVSGAGEWYLGNIGLAVGQLVFMWGFSPFICIIACCAASISGEDNKVFSCLFKCLGALWGSGIIVWWLCDWIMIINGTTNDSNGASLQGF